MSEEQQGNTGDLLGSSFQVRFARDIFGVFEDIEVLNSPLPSVGFRHENSPAFYPIKMPGLGRVGNVVLKRGLFDKDSFQKLTDSMNPEEQAPDQIVVSLRDSQSVMSWILEDALSKSIAGAKVTADGDWTRVDELTVEVGQLVVSVPAHLK